MMKQLFVLPALAFAAPALLQNMMDADHLLVTRIATSASCVVSTGIPALSIYIIILKPQLPPLPIDQIAGQVGTDLCFNMQTIEIRH